MGMRIMFVAAGIATLLLTTQGPAGKGLAQTKAAPKTVKEVMTQLTIPASDAVMNIPLQDKVEDKDWEEMRKQTLVLIESANLLLSPAFSKDNGDWAKASRQMLDVGKKAQAAIAAKDLDKMSIEVSDELLQACSACHDKYMK